MATRFTATADMAYNRANSLGAQTQWTICTWFKHTTTTGDTQTIWGVQASGSDFSCMQTNTGVTSCGLAKSTGTNITTFTVTTGTWYYAGFSCNGANWTLVSRPHGTAAFTTATGSNFNTSTTLTNLEIGRFFGNSEMLNGCVAGFTMWHGATLTEAELINESWHYLPKRTANLTAFYPLLKPETVDYSGNARTLTGGTSATQEDGPGIGWRSRRAALLVPAGASGATVTPSAVATTTSVPAATLSAGSTVAPAAVSATTTTPAPVVGAGATVTPAAIAATTSVPSPGVSTGSTAAPAAVATAATVPAASVSAGSTVAASVVATAASVPSPALSAGSRPTPAAVAAVASVPAPAVSAGGSATVTPAAVAATASVPAAAVSAGSLAAPAAVPATASVAGPSVSAGATITAPATAVTTTVPAPAVSTSTDANVTPAAVAALVAVPAAGLSAGSTVTPQPVAATTTMPAPSMGVASGGSMAVRERPTPGARNRRRPGPGVGGRDRRGPTMGGS